MAARAGARRAARASSDAHRWPAGSWRSPRPAAIEPIVGAAKIARFFLGVLTRQPDLRADVDSVNGQPGLVTRAGDTVLAVISLDIADDGRIRRLWAVRNPDKLAAWR